MFFSFAVFSGVSLYRLYIGWICNTTFMLRFACFDELFIICYVYCRNFPYFFVALSPISHPFTYAKTFQTQICIRVLYMKWTGQQCRTILQNGEFSGDMFCRFVADAIGFLCIYSYVTYMFLNGHVTDWILYGLYTWHIQFNVWKMYRSATRVYIVQPFGNSHIFAIPIILYKHTMTKML